MIEIHPQHLSFNQLLSGRLFRIPEFQRSYSWRTKQREDLFGDITKIATSNDGGSHFMATIVGLRRGTRKIITDEHQVIEVIDGQLIGSTSKVMRSLSIDSAICFSFLLD